ncbi:MAG: hypothetical protein WA191_09665, partial [Telluria sp.]
RTVKRLCADDSAATSVKVGYRQASYMKKPRQIRLLGFFFVPGFVEQLGGGASGPPTMLELFSSPFV